MLLTQFSGQITYMSFMLLLLVLVLNVSTDMFSARVDVTTILRAVTALDVSVAHPAVAGTSASSAWVLRKCATVDGFAARQRDKDKRKKYAENRCAERFRPLSHETYGRLGQPAMALLSELGDIVAAGQRSTKTAFMQSALTELSVALQRGNEEVFRMYGFNFAKIAGHYFVPGDVAPTALLG